uniref:ARAD1D45342p n=1 Tax=Blastobotrys adeninivorans TaxID=409370 RepID=A0A060TIB6_BLAAD
MSTTEEPKRVRHRPPRLELTSPSRAEAATLSASSGSSGSLKTPKELATDIAIQCVSPGIAPFASMSEQAKDAVMRSRSIEAQQRKIIAQRMRDGSITSTTVPIPDSLNDTGDEFKPPRSGGSLRPSARRRAPPAMLNLQSSRYGQSVSVGINSAPLGQTMSGSLQLPFRRHAAGARSFSGPELQKLRPQTATGTVPSNSPSSLNGQDGHQRVNRDVRSRSADTSGEGVNSGAQSGANSDNSDDDPEDAALSDDEKDDVELKAIDDEDERRMKRRRLDKRPHSISRVEFSQLRDSMDKDGAKSNGESQAPSSTGASDTEKKQRFLNLCSEMWDLLHS